MTFKEKLAMEHPEAIGCVSSNGDDYGGCMNCPHTYEYDDVANALCMTNGICDKEKINDETCTECWNREMPETIVDIKTGPVDEESRKTQMDIYESLKEVNESFEKATASVEEVSKAFEDSIPRILDSGDRTEFETGAVRDMREGKGRCDLLPLDVIGDIFYYQSRGEAKTHDFKLSRVFGHIYYFVDSGEIDNLFRALIAAEIFDSLYDTYLEVAKHFEEGAKKYGDNNWRKGIPVRCYIDSAVRHYLKYLRGDKDEPHDRAFCWNILCAIWTCKHMPGLNDYRKEEKNG